MRKIGGLALIAVVALSACAAPSPSSQTAPTSATAEAKTEAGAVKWTTKDGKPFDVSSVSFQDSALADFSKAAKAVPGYGNASEETLTTIGRDLCEHYAAGFTTEDLRASNGESLAAVGEASKATVCAK